MSFTGIQATINFYTTQQAEQTNELTDIMTKITQATRQMSDIAHETTSEKEGIKADYSVTDPEYQVEMSAAEDEYNMKLSEITAWESELETQKETKETEVQATTSYLESYKGVLKQNVQKDFKYAQGQ